LTANAPEGRLPAAAVFLLEGESGSRGGRVRFEVVTYREAGEVAQSRRVLVKPDMHSAPTSGYEAEFVRIPD
jgi:hypothetical protein